MCFKNKKVLSLLLSCTFFSGFFSCPTIKKRISPVIRGATVAHVHQKGKGYGSGISKTLYHRLKKKGYNAIQLNTFAYQKSIKQIRLVWNDPTLTEKDILKEIKLAKSYKFQVMLKPHIWLTESWKPNIWRNQIDYKSKEKIQRWFDEYTKFIKNQVKMAIQSNVDFFVIGTELVKLTKYEKHWRKLIADIREWGYKGKLTYACEAWNAKHIAFWDKLDFIGLDFYYSYKGSEDDNDIIDFYSSKLKDHIYHAQDFNLPIMFTEVGFPSHQKAIRNPALWRSNSLKQDNARQKKGYEILRKSMEKVSYPYGIWIWKFVTTLDSYESNAYPTGFNVERKPAEEEILKMFKL